VVGRWLTPLKLKQRIKAGEDAIIKKPSECKNGSSTNGGACCGYTNPSLSYHCQGRRRCHKHNYNNSSRYRNHMKTGQLPFSCE